MENEKPMTLNESIANDIQRCRSQEKNGSQRLFLEFLAKYSGLIPNFKDNLSIMGKATVPGEEFDYTDELNAVAAKLEMYLLQHPRVETDSHSPRKKYDVFISHASKDEPEYVDLLVMAVRRLGLNVFYDMRAAVSPQTARM